MYNDYPQSATRNAQRALDYAKENGWGSCGTAVGKQRANQLANRENLSLDTVRRTYQFLARAKTYYDGGSLSKCGNIMYLAWGGDSMLGWARKKFKEESQKD